MNMRGWLSRIDKNLLTSATREKLRAYDFDGQKAKAEKAIRVSWFMLIFGVVRTLGWIVLAALYFVGPFIGITHIEALFGSIVFVAMISLYANAATDYDQVTSAWAAIHAARAHRTAIEAAQRAAIIETEIKTTKNGGGHV
jgi:hypothetical protein